MAKKKKTGRSSAATDENTVESTVENNAAAGPSVWQRLEVWLESRQGYCLLIVGLGLLTLVTGWWTFDPKLGVSGDNTEFIVLSRSIVQGEGIQYVNEPQPSISSRFPFGFPLMLAFFEWLFPSQWEPMKWMVVVLFAVSVPVVFQLVKDELGLGAGLVAAVACLSNFHLLSYAHQIMSEVPYLLFSMIALLFFGRIAASDAVVPKWWWGVGFAAMMWAYYLRGVGLVLVGTVVLYLLAQRYWRSALWVGLGAFLVALPWVIRNHLAGKGSTYFKQLLMANPYYPERGAAGWQDFIDGLELNSVLYSNFIIPWTLWPDPDKILPQALGFTQPLALLLLAVAVYAMVLCIIERRHLLLLAYTAFYLATVLLWPWPGERFLVPIIPLLIFFVIKVALDIRQRLARFNWGKLKAIPPLGRYNWGKIVWTVAAVGLGGTSLVHNLVSLNVLAHRGRQGHVPEWHNYFLAGWWIKQYVPKDAIIACRKPYWMHVVSTRKAIAYPFKSPEEVMAFIQENGIEFVVIDNLGFRQTPLFLVPTVQKYSQHFERIWYHPDPDTFIFRYKGAAKGTG